MSGWDWLLGAACVALVALAAALPSHAQTTTGPTLVRPPKIVVPCARKSSTGRCIERAPLQPGTVLRATHGRWE